ncbi:MAG: glycosyltransferase family 2 protein [Methylovirgula sp.]|jgi:glycosyltransferase involved in cell wall biosynthesis
MNIANVPDGLAKPVANMVGKLMTPQFHLPLVSIVIVNYNYARYLNEAVESVLTQTYSNIECVIVDNASTDETPAVLASLCEKYPQLTIIRRLRNDGQTAATLDGFKATTGQYVIFLDADDVLLARAIETHIYVHLSSRIHIGFTAGDMLQAYKGNIIVATGEAMNKYIRRRHRNHKNIWRPYRYQPGWPSPQIADELSLKAIYVPPLCVNWIWTPTSGLCYRRDALLLFADNERLPNLWTATDTYFAHGIGGWCGSVLIDEPVFIYRLHGSNLFSQTAQLHNTLNYQPGGSGDHNDHAIALIIDQLIYHSERFSQNLLFKLYLLILLFRLDRKENDRTLPRWAARSCVAHGLVTHFDRFSAQLGRPITFLFMTLFRVPIRVVRECEAKKAATQARSI